MDDKLISSNSPDLPEAGRTMSNMEINIKPAELLTAIHNILNKRFFEARKNDAKQLFNAIIDGQEIPLMRIATNDKSEVSCNLALDKSEFIGSVNYRTFRNALASHLYRISQKLNNKEDLNIFTSAETGAMIFHIPGLVETGDDINILVTGIEQKRPGIMTVKLQFLNPEYLQGQGG